MIVLSEASPDLDPEKSDRDITGATRVALELGLPVQSIPGLYRNLRAALAA